MRIVFILVLVSFSFNYSLSQVNKTLQHSFFVELLGTGGIHSINYEVSIPYNGDPAKEGGSFNLRLGLGYGDKDGRFLNPFDRKVFSIPVNLSYAFGSKNKFVLGIGATHFSVYESFCYLHNHGQFNCGSYKWYKSYNIVPKIAYRYQEPSKGLFFEVAFTPHLGTENSDHGLFAQRRDYYKTDIVSQAIYFGISVGFTFRKKKD